MTFVGSNWNQGLFLISLDLFFFFSVVCNDMIMNTALDINSEMMVFHGYNVCFYDSLCATDDWLVLLWMTSNLIPNNRLYKAPTLQKNNKPIKVIKYDICVSCLICISLILLKIVLYEAISFHFFLFHPIPITNNKYGYKFVRAIINVFSPFPPLNRNVLL